jgi:hypothetical protein
VREEGLGNDRHAQRPRKRTIPHAQRSRGWRVHDDEVSDPGRKRLSVSAIRRDDDQGLRATGATPSSLRRVRTRLLISSRMGRTESNPLASGVLGLQDLVPLAGVDRAGVAAAHRTSTAGRGRSVETSGLSDSHGVGDPCPVQSATPDPGLEAVQSRLSQRFPEVDATVVEAAVRPAHHGLGGRPGGPLPSGLEDAARERLRFADEAR